jgi:site-specific DNA recombinase
MRKLPKEFKIGAYIRVSTEEQAENPEGSIKNQEARLRDYVTMKNQEGPFGELVEVFCDPGVSAKDMNRPAFQRLLREIQSGEINLVLVTELSRLTRSTKDFAILWEFMNEHGCKFQSLRDNFDTTSPAGEMIMFTLANFAQFERKQLGERVMNSFKARAKRGLWNGGVVPLGFDVDKERNGHLKVIASEAEIVREVFETFLKEETLSRTGKALNAKGLRMPRKVRNGGSHRHPHFTVDNVYRILRNKAYIGVRVYHAKEGVLEVKAIWDGIVDPMKFERVQKILTNNKALKKPPAENRYPYILSGLIFCKVCGDRLCGKSAHGNGGKIGYYEHSRSTKAMACMSKKVLACDPVRILAKKVEPVVWDDVKRILTNKGYAQKIFEEAQALNQRDSKKQEIEKMKAKIASLNSQIATTTERVSELPKEVDAKVFYEQIIKLQKLKSGLESVLESLKLEDVAFERALSFEAFEVFTENLRSLALKADDPEVRAAICRKLIERVDVSTTGITIHYHVGDSHYLKELGGMSREANGVLKSSQEGLAGFSPRPVSKPLAKYREEFKMQNFIETKPNFFYDAGSNSLINGRGRGTRTPDPPVMSRLL